MPSATPPSTGVLGVALVGETLAQKYDVTKLALLFEHGRLAAFLQSQHEAQALGGWLGRLLPYAGTKAVADHNLWPYFTQRFGLDDAWGDGTQTGRSTNHPASPGTRAHHAGGKNCVSFWHRPTMTRAQHNSWPSTPGPGSFPWRITLARAPAQTTTSA